MTEKSIYYGEWHAQTYEGRSMVSITYKGRRVLRADFFTAIAVRRMCSDAVWLQPTGRNRQMTPVVECYAFSFKGISLCKTARHSSVVVVVGNHVKAIMNNRELGKFQQIMYMACQVMQIKKEMNERWESGRQKCPSESGTPRPMTDGVWSASHEMG